MPLPQLLDIAEALGEFTELRERLPGPSARVGVAGLHGSSDAVIIAVLARAVAQRFFVVVSDDVAGAERWLADLSTLVEPDQVAFYPPRESFGEAEAHAEIAGERVETLERIGRGDLRIVVTTSRALLEFGGPWTHGPTQPSANPTRVRPCLSTVTSLKSSRLRSAGQVVPSVQIQPR